jgi:hypothetical protein
MVFKWSRGGEVLLRSGVNKVLLLAGFYPDSQNLRSDGAARLCRFACRRKIRSIIESSKYFWTFLLLGLNLVRFPFGRLRKKQYLCTRFCPNEEGIIGII